MKCPYCGFADSKVLDSRDASDLETTRRRRECESCGKRFTTYERVEGVDLTVVKKDGRREAFDRHKLLTGVLKACEKRPVSREAAEALVDEVERELRARADTEVPTAGIGDLVMRKLKLLDEVAYIRFASVYRSFQDVESFEKELKALIRTR